MLLFLLACTTATDTAAATYPTCEFDFEATITEGPDAGTSLVGTLHVADLSALQAGGAFGELVVSETERYMVGATVGDSIELWFILHDGSVIHGVGDMSTSLADCVGATVEGAAEGPATEDKGDWFATGTRNLSCSIVCQCSTAESTTSACSNACAIYGLDLSSAEGMACISDCSANLDQSCSCTYSSGTGGSVSQFFPPTSCS